MKTSIYSALNLQVAYPSSDSSLSISINPFWVALDLLKERGCFYIQLTKSKTHKTGFQVVLRFFITQHTRDIELMNSLIHLFNCGRVIRTGGKLNQEWINFEVWKTGDIINKIIPFFHKYSLLGEKSKDFRDFQKVARLVQNKAHLTIEGIEKIKSVKSGMNKGRVSKEHSFDCGKFAKGASQSSVRGVNQITIKRGYRSMSSPLFSNPRSWGPAHSLEPSKNKLWGESKVRSNTELHTTPNLYFNPSSCSSRHGLQDLKDKSFKEWLAGIIDGDGCFLLSKKGYASLEISNQLRDRRILYLIKQKYGGSVSLFAGNNYIRYRLHHKAGLLKLINGVNGLLYNPTRILQLGRICKNYGIELKDSQPLTYYSGWFAGFFDTDGSIYFSAASGQIFITASQKNRFILEPLVDLYGGKIYPMVKQEAFKWTCFSKKEILSLVNDYFKVNPLRSEKFTRVTMVNRFYELKKLNAHKASPNSDLGKVWKHFMVKWDNFMSKEELGRIRCTRNSRILSLPIKINIPAIPHSKFYSSKARQSSLGESHRLDPWFITGFIDAEGSVILTVRRQKSNRLGWRVDLQFRIKLQLTDKALLEKIKASLNNIGNVLIVKNKEKEQAVFVVYTMKDLAIIVDQLERFPLITQKKADFELFKEAYEIVKNKEHLTLEGLNKIISIKEKMNTEQLSDELKAALPDRPDVQRPIVENQKVLHPLWFSGFVSGDGCLMVKTNRTNFTLEFTVTQDKRDEQLMNSFSSYFGCGKCYFKGTVINFTVTKFPEIHNKIIPFFKQHPIQGVKAKDFADFSKAAEIIKNKGHLTPEGKKQIIKLKYGMNSKRKI